MTTVYYRSNLIFLIIRLETEKKYIYKYSLERLGDSRLEMIGIINLLPFEHSITISSSNVPSESGANLILKIAPSPGAMTDCPCGY
jgi:hypothetical protein